jgi:rubredoxin
MTTKMTFKYTCAICGTVYDKACGIMRYNPHEDLKTIFLK